MKPHFRISQSSVADLSGDKLWNTLLKPITTGLMENEQKAWTLLTPGQKALLALGQLAGEVENGGIHQYLFNSAGDHAHDALDGARLFKAQACVDLLLKTYAPFPNGEVPTDRKRRQELLETFSREELERLFDKPFYALDENPTTKLANFAGSYIKNHPDDFFLHQGEPDAVDPLLDPARWKSDYRINRSVVANKSKADFIWSLIEICWDDFWNSRKIGRLTDFLSRLTIGQKAVLFTDVFEKNIVNQGGILSFLVCFGDLTEHVRQAYQILEASPYRDALGNVLIAFPSEILGNSVVIREKASRSVPYGTRNQIEDEFQACFAALISNESSQTHRYIEKFVHQNPGQFFLD